MRPGIFFARLGIWMSVLAAPALSSAAAVVIYSNFSAGSYNISQGNPAGNAFDGNDYAEGDTFIASGDAIFDSLRIALSCFASCTDPFLVTLTQDAGNQPGTALEMFTVPSSVLGTLGANNPPLMLNSAVKPALSAGTRYWITVGADLNDSIAWNLNSIGDSAAEAISTDNGSSWFSPSGNTPGAFEVRGIVPEPGGLGFMVSAGLLFGLIVVSSRALMEREQDARVEARRPIANRPQVRQPAPQNGGAWPFWSRRGGR